MEDLEKRLASDPKSRMFAQLAEEYRKSGLIEQAIDVCEHGLKFHSNYHSGRFSLGRALLEAKFYERACVEFEAILRQAPDNILANKFLGTTYHRLGRLDEARNKYQIAVAMAPEEKDLQERIQALELDIVARRTSDSASPVLEKLEKSNALELPSVQNDFNSSKLSPIVVTGKNNLQETILNKTVSPYPHAQVSLEQEGISSVTGIPDPDRSLEDDPDTPRMAELFASQGHLQQAISVYERILLRQPGESGYRERIAELQGLTHVESEPQMRGRKTVAGQENRRNLIRRLERWLEAINRNR